MSAAYAIAGRRIPMSTALLAAATSAPRGGARRGSTSGARTRSSAPTRSRCRRRATRNGASPTSRRSPGCSFQPAAAAPRPAMADIARFVAPEATARLVFVDGVYAPELSATAGLPEGVVGHAARGGARDARRRDRAASRAPRRFRARRVRRAQHRPPARRRVRPDRAQPEVPGAGASAVHVRPSRRRRAYPRCLVVAEAGAECTLIEDYVSLRRRASISPTR